MKIQHFMALVVFSLPTVPGARAAVRGFKARTLVPGLLALACLLVAAPATAQVNYAVSGSTAYVASSPNASGAIVIASTYNGYPVTSIGYQAFSNCTSLRDDSQRRHQHRVCGVFAVWCRLHMLLEERIMENISGRF